MTSFSKIFLRYLISKCPLWQKKRLKSPLSYLNIPIPVFYFDVEIRYFFVHVPFTLTILSWHSYFTTLNTAHPPLLLVVSVRHTLLWCYCLSKIAQLVCYFIMHHSNWKNNFSQWIFKILDFFSITKSYLFIMFVYQHIFELLSFCAFPIWGPLHNSFNDVIWKHNILSWDQS